MEQNQFKEIVLLVDANYLDYLVGGFRSFLAEKMEQELPVADLAAWIVNAAMGVMWEKTENPQTADFSKQEINVVLVCEKGQTTLGNFAPSDLLAEVDGMAFREERFGEFLMSVIQDEHLVEGEPLLVQSSEMLLTSNRVKHLIIVPDPENGLDAVREMTRVNKGMDVEVLCMESDENSEGPSLLGVSLLHSLGLTVDKLFEESHSNI